MLECRRGNRRHRGYQWFKLKHRRRKGILPRARRPGIKIH
jgi:hypothetical protein